MMRERRADGLEVNRREFLGRAAMGFAGLGWMTLGAEAAAPTAGGAHFRSRAKHVIHLFMNGGPSHVDTFDPKPALARYAGRMLPMDNLRTERQTGAAFPSPFRFDRHGASGLEISELFPEVSRHADDLAVIRSMHADVPNHEPSLMLMNCGEARLVRPSFGSWVTYGLGLENRNLPGFISMCPGGYPIQETQNWQSAFLPGIFQGTYVDSRHKELERLIENVRHPDLKLTDQRRQLDLLGRLNRRHASAHGGEAALESRIQSFELAYGMQIEAADAFDLSREPDSVRKLYGDNIQGRQMLIARRLVERGVRFVQIWHGAGQPWDNHDDLEVNHRRLARDSDQAIGALLTDLKRTGLLDETIVVWGGEFGRTPTVELPTPGANAGKINGRDHNHWGFSMWMAGGGVRGGTVYGATDEFGFKAEENPVHVHDLHATILALLGFDHERLTFRHAGRDFRLTDVHGRVIRDLIS